MNTKRIFYKEKRTVIKDVAVGFRTNSQVKEQAMLLADKSGVSLSGYLTTLIIRDLKRNGIEIMSKPKDPK